MNADCDGLALAAAIRAGRTSAALVMAAALERAAALAPIGALRHIDADLGRRLAMAADLAANPGVFAGLPFLMKDLGSAAAGLPLVCGSAALTPSVATSDAELTARFRDAGLLPFGVTTAPEFGLSLASEPAIGPIARNPLDPSRTPGGSSGGAAAAVAAGIVALAHATDAGGSIRVPAACCGLVGLKPSRGAFPGGLDFANHLGGLASEFALTRSLADAAALFDACSGRARGPYPDPQCGAPVLALLDRPPAGLRIGLCVEAETAIGAAQRDAAAGAADILAQAGHRIVPLAPERLAALTGPSQMVFDRVISANLARLTGDLAGLEPLSQAVVRHGRSLSGADLSEADLVSAKVAHGLWRLFDEVDILLTPMLAGPPPALGTFPTDHGDVSLQWRRMAAFAPFALLANVAGSPALALPHGSADGLPSSVQLIGPMGADGLLLRLGRMLENVHPWRFDADIAGMPE